VELSVTVPAGQRLEEPRSNSDRIGYAIAVGESGPEAAARALSAIESVAVRLAPGAVRAAARAGVTPSRG